MTTDPDRKPAPPHPMLADLHTLVVEDDAFQRAVLVSLVRGAGVGHVEQADNGSRALAALLAGDRPIDLILCDLEMPEMDGVDFLRTVAERRLAHAVIIVSAREPDVLWSAEAMARAYGLTVLGRVQKPATARGLDELLAKAGTAADSSPLRASPAPVDPGLLKRALKGGEFSAVFQPKVSLDTGRLAGVEALARWQGPQAVGPATFVPATVNAGLINVLTELVLTEACRALKSWAGSGLELGAAVNVSMASLGDVALANRLAAVVAAEGVAPELITFEITETELMTDAASVLNVLTRLRLKGFRLAIDDFGTGYSSLAQLTTCPFTELKIDRTFVRHCDETGRLRDIVRSSIDLARRLGLRTVAEGIETRAECELLRAAGCDEGQGYYIARPMPGDELVAWASRWRAGAWPP